MNFLTEKLKYSLQRRNMLRFKAFGMIDLKYEFKNLVKILNKATNNLSG